MWSRRHALIILIMIAHLVWFLLCTGIYWTEKYSLM